MLALRTSWRHQTADGPNRPPAGTAAPWPPPGGWVAALPKLQDTQEVITSGPDAAAGPGSQRTMAAEMTALRWLDPPAGPAIVLLDQTRLPAEETYLTCADVPQLVEAIRRLAVRGAPLLGVAGAFGVGLAASRGDDVEAAAAAIAAARPTAVNLGWGVRRALAA